ncbi:MAG: hypothetical protein M3401_00985 [Actinomycetota bacterium]|nr:hypothetical protein [Actinomycetota bacterium]
MEGGPTDPGLPPDVEITNEARRPVDDSTLGVAVQPRATAGKPRHRLVAIGDSLTHGFKNLAVHDTRLSYPAMIARELGWEKDFRFPRYDSPGGLPLDLEWLLRELEPQVGAELELGDAAPAILAVRRLLEEQEDFWERGAGSRIVRDAEINHNLAIYGWDLRDVLSRDADTCHDELVAATDKAWPSVPQNSGPLAALRVLESARDAGGRALTPLEAAAQLGAAGAVGDDGAPVVDGDGIETLIVFIGSNNALPTVLTLDVSWSRLDYANLAAKEAYTVWRPTHFAAELRAVSEAAIRIRARHVLWLTIPHVTIAPLARGLGGKIDPASRYFRYYGRPWVGEERFLADPSKYPHLTATQVRAVDSAIDQYNEAIVETVRNARTAGHDWHVVDLSGVLDRMATRRYFDQPETQPQWWKPYEMPTALTDALGFTPTTEFLRSGPGGIEAGGIVALDGVHPTTVGYSLVAHECMKVMKQIGVRFYAPTGEERTDPQIDFARVVREDTLLSTPLRTGVGSLELLGKLDDRFALIAGFERALRRRKRAQ